MTSETPSDAFPAGPDTRLDEDAYPVWKESFDAQTRRDQVDEDLLAGRSVAGLLTVVVTMGVILGAIGVLFCLV